MIGYGKTPTPPFVKAAALMAAGGKITNDNDDYHIDDQGYHVTSADGFEAPRAYIAGTSSEDHLRMYANQVTLRSEIRGLNGHMLTLRSMGSQHLELYAGGNIVANDPLEVGTFTVPNSTQEWPWGLRSTTPSVNVPSNGILWWIAEDTDGDGNTIGLPAYTQDNGNDWWLPGETAFSDRRGKENIEPLTAPIDALMGMSGYIYERKGKRTFDRGRQLGLMAQDVRTVLPEAVVEKTNGDLHLDYKQLHALHVEAGKKLVEVGRDHEKRIVELETEVEELKADNERLQERIADLA